MRNFKKPPFIVGLFSIIVFVIAFVLMGNKHPFGLIVLYTGCALVIINWIWTIIEVSNAGTDELKKYQKSFWIILVVAVPLFGSLLYHLAHQRRRKIAA